LKPKRIWAIRVRLGIVENHRDLALVNLTNNRKVRGCDLVRIKVIEAMTSRRINERASVMQSKTQKPVRFEISRGTHFIRRTKATPICRKTGTLCAVQLFLGIPRIDSAVRYLEIELEDALAISETIET
jgi:hypothetical protein